MPQKPTPPPALTATAVKFVSIDEDRAGQRIDNFLITQLKGAPKSFIYRIVRKGEVRVNKGRIKPDYKLKNGDIVRVPPVKLPSFGFCGARYTLSIKRQNQRVGFVRPHLKIG